MSLDKKTIESIEKARINTNTQLKLMYLLMSQISDIRADRINLFNLEHRNIKIESYTIFGNQIVEVINDIRFNKNADHWV